MKNLLTISFLVLIAASGAMAQTNTGVAIQNGTTLLPTNAAGVIASAISTNFATAAQGAKADSALQPTNSLAWSNVVGTPDTLGGYGITNAVERGETVGSATNASWAASANASYSSLVSDQAQEAGGLFDGESGARVLERVDDTWGGDLAGLAAALEAAQPKFATFDIPLGGGYTDFELKATTNAWAGMVFFYHSPDPAKAVIPQQVWTNRPNVFFTDSQYVGSPVEKNQRYWRTQTATNSIAAMRANTNSVIAGITVVVRDMGAINPRNGNLVWSYCRMTPTGYEEGAGGKSIWRPITPKWVSQPFTP